MLALLAPLGFFDDFFVDFTEGFIDGFQVAGNDDGPVGTRPCNEWLSNSTSCPGETCPPARPTAPFREAARLTAA